MFSQYPIFADAGTGEPLTATDVLVGEPPSARVIPTNATGGGHHTGGLLAIVNQPSQFNLALIALVSTSSLERDRRDLIPVHNSQEAADDTEINHVERLLDEMWAAWPAFSVCGV